MASLMNVSFFMFLAIFLLPSLVHMNILLPNPDVKDELLQGINSYRNFHNLSSLAVHEKASCVADEVADTLKNHPCTAVVAKMPIQVETYPQLLAECGVGVNHSTDAIALPTCVPKLVTTLLLTNYTETDYASYLNDSRFIWAGLGFNRDWMVVILTTNTTEGNFSKGYSLVSEYAFNSCLLSLFVGFLLLLV